MGTNERRRIEMTSDEVAAFLDEERTLRMSTMNHDGTIHSVAMWFGLLDGAVAVTTKARSQKVANLRRDPRMTYLVDAGSAYGELRGVELVGEAEIVEERSRLEELAVDVGRRQGAAEPEPEAIDELLHKRVGIRMARVDRVVSWDHRKLAR